MKKIWFLLIPVISFLIPFFVWTFFGSVGNSSQTTVFVVPQDKSVFGVEDSLKEKNYIKNSKAFYFLLYNFGGKSVEPGGYHLSGNMNAWQVMKKVTGKPDLVWVKISYCLRKEQIGEILQEALGWDSAKLDTWNSLYKDKDTEYVEGVYYPDTYLIPVNETPNEVAQRFINRFNEKFNALSSEFAAKNIKWTTGLKIASLIAREAGGVSDMKTISGVIWNRLDSGMPLQIDATMQYTLGKRENGSWWGPVDLAEKKNDSPYNSYLHKGLPPTPICSPGIEAIEAVLNPEDTDCLFYLHDSFKEIHCAATYSEHLENIKKYLNY